ncbi:MAG: hypothetical protein ACRDHF_07615, partial [Tepidiformaceae bacterium]
LPVLPAPVAAELDYMLTQRGGSNANDRLLRDLASGRFHVPCLEPAEYVTIQALNQQYHDLDVGLTDLSIVVFAARFRTTRVLTFDQRHFRTLRPLQGGSFNLVAYDEPPPRGGRT